MYVVPFCRIPHTDFFGRPVFEYPLNGQWIMMDIDDGYVLWTGIWKGLCFLNRTEASRLTHVFSQHSEIRKVRLVS